METPPPKPGSLVSLLQSSTRELWIYGCMAAAGAAGGAVVGEVAIRILAWVMPDLNHESTLRNYLFTGTLAALCGAGIALGFLLAGTVSRRAKLPGLGSFGFAFCAGAAAGCFSGLIAQAFFALRPQDDWVTNYLLRPSAWALMGAILGLLLAYTVPNLGQVRGTIGGAVGGTLGAIGFVIVGIFMPNLMARMCGFAILGLALGLCMVAIDVLSREASLEVIWGPNESAMLSLGPKAISIGGGADTVYVAGLSPNLASVHFVNGRIEYIESATNRTTVLRNGSRLKLGKVEVVVHSQS